MKFRTRFLVLSAPLLAMTYSANGQLLRPNYVLPDFMTTQPEYSRWEYSRWDKFYTPHDNNGTQTRNRNYPDIAAPNGYRAVYIEPDEIGPLGDVAEVPEGSGHFVYVGPFLGDYVWGDQSFAEATASGYTGQLPTNPNPSQPRTIFHAANPSIRQHSTGGFIIGPGYTGNIYSFSTIVSYQLEDSLDYDAGSVVFQFQNQGRDVDMDSIKLRYLNGSTWVEMPATDTIIEREAFASHAGFTFTTRSAAEWNLAGLGIRNYEIVWKAKDTSCSIQEVLLDTTDAYVRDKGLPAKRIFQGTAGTNWNDAANWHDVAGNTSSPRDNANLVLSNGTGLSTGDTTRKVSLLETNLPGNFTVDGTGTIELGTGYRSAASTTPQVTTFNVPVTMTAFNFFNTGANTRVVLNAPFSGNTGFEKTGDGTLDLAGNNSFSGALFVSGGKLNVSGYNSYGGADLDQTYIYLGEITLESSGVLGGSGVPVAIGSTPYEVVGESRPSRLVVKGERTFDRPVDFTGGYNPKYLGFTETGVGAVCSSPVTLHDGTELGIFGTENPTGDVELATPLATDKVTFTDAFSGGATISGAPQTNAVRKTGPGTLVFSGTAKSYKHQTRVEAGTLLLESGTGITGGNGVTVAAGATFTAQGPVNLTASRLTVNGLLDGAGALVRSGNAFISGSGTIAKNLTIDQATTLAPGGSPGLGVLTLAGAQTFGPAGRMEVDVKDTTTAAGHDRVEIQGALALTATQAVPFLIDVRSLAWNGAAGTVADFNGYGNYTWVLATATGGISGFVPEAFGFVTTNFTNTLAGNFSVEVQGQSLVLRYTSNASPATSFAAWAASLPAGLQGANQDGDGDGLANLVEFATGSDGSLPQAAGSLLSLRRVVTGGSALDFTLAEPFRPGVTVKLLGSQTLQAADWELLGIKSGLAAWQGTGVVTEGTAAAGQKPVSIAVPDTGDGKKRFFRLEFRNE